eukprot:TRINITY_DN5735_c0_g1_i5.p1 TRINITY_DN5735_c0_g1~~TRINITY_DN5735_c0_g1_i5.p1  ORF type:complete len:163 (-),score=20.86 TRINITY_DN5735_c0_g1_i5:697-1185(-)
MKASLSPAVQTYAEEIANNEIAHVAVLRAALGDAAPACPQIDIGPAFAAAANAAVGTTLSPAYTPYFNDEWFLLGSFIFEDVGVTAYNGAATLLTNKSVLGAAASILAVEAYHGGSIRTVSLRIAVMLRSSRAKDCDHFEQRRREQKTPITHCEQRRPSLLH